MAIDSSIYFQQQPVQLPNQLNQLAAFGQIQQQQNQNKLAQYQLDRASQEDAMRVGTNKAFTDATDPITGKVDYGKAQANLAASGLGSAIPGIAKSAAEAQKAEYEAQKAQLAQGLQRLEIGGQIMAGVKDQATYDQAKAQAASYFGPQFVANWDPVYNPQVVEANKMKALGIKDQLEQKWKQLGYDLDLRKQSEVERNNRSQNAVAQGQLGVAQQRLAFEQSQPKGVYDKDNGIIVDPRTGKSMPVTDQNGQPITPAGKAPTEFQGKNAVFGSRAEAADKILSDLTGKYSVGAVNLKSTSKGALGTAMNFALSPESQKAEQAQRDFINAVLRQESGAAIAESEFDNARKQYFPQPGDSKEVVAQKAANRQLVIQGFKDNSGPLAKKSFGKSPASTSPGVPQDIGDLLNKYGS